MHYYIKDTLNKYKNSFKYKTKKNSTKLSNYVRDNKKDKQEPSFNWYIKKAKAYSHYKMHAYSHYKMHVMAMRKNSYFIF